MKVFYVDKRGNLYQQNSKISMIRRALQLNIQYYTCIQKTDLQNEARK